MDLLNQTLNSFSAQISDLEVSLNTDIFETNVINIALLLGGVIYLLSGALGDALSERQKKILGAIQESEERLQEATARFSESETQLAQAHMVIDSIKTDSDTTAKQVKSTVLSEGKIEIERLTSAAKAQITTIEAKVRKQIADQVVALALSRVTTQLSSVMNDNLQQQIIDRNISKLGD